MKQYTKFSKRASILFTASLLFSWIYYYLFLYAYLPDNSFTTSLYSFAQVLLLGVPILTVILLLSLLCIRKPKFRKLNTEISIFLAILFLLNLFTSIYSSHDYVVTGPFTVEELLQKDDSFYVLVTSDHTSQLLHCKAIHFKQLQSNNTYLITYLGNDLTTKVIPTITSVDSLSENPS